MALSNILCCFRTGRPRNTMKRKAGEEEDAMGEMVSPKNRKIVSDEGELCFLFMFALFAHTMVLPCTIGQARRRLPCSLIDSLKPTTPRSSPETLNRPSLSSHQPTTSTLRLTQHRNLDSLFHTCGTYDTTAIAITTLSSLSPTLRTPLLLSAMPDSAQNKAIGDFVQVTQMDKKSAQKFLKQHNWNAANAINA